MQSSLTKTELAHYLKSQLNNFFPDKQVVNAEMLQQYLSSAMDRLEYCIKHIRRKYFFDGNGFLFNHLQSDQYAMLLYLLANTIYKEEGDLITASKVYYLNKSLHGIDVFYEVELPEIFLFRHCSGTILGRAKYSNYFTVGQNCTVGNNKGVYPEFGEYVAMYNGSMVAGKCNLGTNCHVSAHTFIRNQSVPDNSIVFGKSPDIETKATSRSVRESFFNPM